MTRTAFTILLVNLLPALAFAQANQPSADVPNPAPTTEEPPGTSREAPPAPAATPPSASGNAPDRTPVPAPTGDQAVPVQPSARANDATVDLSHQASEPSGTPGKRWTLGVAPRVGLTVPTSKLGAFVAGGLEIDFAPPWPHRWLRNRLIIALDASMTRPSHDGTAMDARLPADAQYTIRETELKFGLDAVYRLPLAGTLSGLIPFGGLGPVVQVLRSRETTSLAPSSNSAVDTYIGFELVGGVDYRLGPGFLLGEARIIYTDLDDLLTGDSNGGNVVVSLGYRMPVY